MNDEKNEKFEQRTFTLSNIEVRMEGEAGAPTVSGDVVMFEQLSVPLWGFREKVRKGAFDKSLRKSIIKALWNHNSDLVLGSTKNRTLRLWEDDMALRFELDLPNTTWGKDAAESIRRGDVDGVSFGFEVVKDEWDYDDPSDVIRTLIEVNLYEISPTPFPAYPDSSVDMRSAKRTFERFTASRDAENQEAAKEEQEQRKQKFDAMRKRIALAEMEA
ncbi:prohead peptidase [Aneurinibacillus soli]|uniref:Caudovirus prohead protease n=1 Tax=Aneurinibacillus soli TaxID=1500254 RepID=A0A0U5BBG0_9BACL|nr:HK97 family phage prohead protease [Aneurinibacillus soli]PYE62975.1 prohead peptidase [Aneurinibacillus soli]BAU28966.1 Caudovirus prohead protease [Aneurinibacillus soli]